MNVVMLSGGVTKADVRKAGNADLIAFTLAVSRVRYDGRAREDVIETVWCSCEWFVPTGLVAEEELLYKGDKVSIVGEVYQYKGSGGDGQPHTRFLAHQLTIMRRGNEALQALRDRPGQRQQQQPSAEPRYQEQPAGPNPRWEEPPF